MNSSLSLRKVLVVSMLVVIAYPQVATAGTPTKQAFTSTVHVPYTDLNLSNSAGLNVLHNRLSNAARAVCGQQSDLKLVGSLKQLRINKECYDNTLAQALAEVNFPSVAQVITR